MEKKESFYSAGGNVSWHSHYGKLYKNRVTIQSCNCIPKHIFGGPQALEHSLYSCDARA